MKMVIHHLSHLCSITSSEQYHLCLNSICRGSLSASEGFLFSVRGGDECRAGFLRGGESAVDCALGSELLVCVFADALGDLGVPAGEKRRCRR